MLILDFTGWILREFDWGFAGFTQNQGSV